MFKWPGQQLLPIVDEKACQQCGKLFVLSDDPRHVAKYCSGACKAKAYRERKKLQPVTPKGESK